MRQPRHAKPDHADANHSPRLLAMAVLSFVMMFVLMYAMVDRMGNVHANLNQAYMAGLMTAPMVVIELLLMRRMYPDRRLNAWLMAASLIAMAVCWACIRQQTAIADRQFLRSMIPHHAGAILMCREAELQDAGLRALCHGIIASQQAEIDYMAARLQDREAGPTGTAR